MLDKHFGHWKVLETPEIIRNGDVDLNKYIGFVYVISFTDGTKYIGAKKIWKRITKPPCEFKRGPKRGYEQSDWRTYTSSSTVVNEKIDSGIVPEEYLIVGFYDTWGKTLFAEACLQLKVNIFNYKDGCRVWLNYQVEGMFTKSCWDETIDENNNAYYNNYTAVEPLYRTFTNIFKTDIQIDGKEYKSQPLSDLIGYDVFLKLVTGKIDNIGGITLSTEHKRKDWKFSYDDKYYQTQTDILNDVEFSKKDFKKMGVVENKVETRTEYIKRLTKVPIEYKIERRYL